MAYGFEDLIGMFGSEDDDEDNLTHRPRNPYMMNFGGAYSGGSVDPTASIPEQGIDPAEEATARYIAKAKEPLPSEGMYQEYLKRRPDISSPENKPKWWELLVGSLAQLGGEGAKRAGGGLIHRRYGQAYRDWETEGKYLTPAARAADTARQRELEAERFGIIGQAKKKQFEETKRVHTATEATRTAKEEAARLKQEKADTAAANREERAIRTEERLTKAAELSGKREERISREEEEKDLRQKNLDRIAMEEKRTKAIEEEDAEISEKVADEIASDPRYKDYFSVDKKGNIVVTSKGTEAGVEDLIRGEIKKRKEVNRLKYGRR